MLCAFPVYSGDVTRLLNLIRWIRQLGGCQGHEAVIVTDPAVTPASRLELREQAKRSFDSVQCITTPRSIKGWPEGPNELFLRAAYFARERNMAWLFMEPDAVPLCPGWLDKIEIHYRAKGARYLGQIVPCYQPGLPEKHFTGVGVYPANAILNVEWSVRQNPRMAFDISTAKILVPIATHSGLFQHLWGEVGNPPRFAEKGIPHTAVFGLDYLRPEAVVFHRNKDGTLIDLLRRKHNLVDVYDTRTPFIQLGRFGDIILLLPAMRHIAKETGVRPKMIVSKDYGSVLDGVSYVERITLPVHWYMGMPQARRYAEQHFGGGRVLQCHGHKWGVNIKKWPSFMVSMLDRTGVPMELFHQLPLVFDQRNPAREAAAVPKLKKPYVAINCHGVSSPFQHGPKVFEILRHLSRHLALVDMSRIRCHRIYDLMGVMDGALGTITTDTATLHLAHGCPNPYIAITVDGWTTSTPRGNCVLEVKYSRFMSSLATITQTVESWL